MAKTYSSEWVQGDDLVNEDIELISLAELPDDTPEFLAQARAPVPISRVKLKYPVHETVWRWFLRTVALALAILLVAYFLFPAWLEKQLPEVKQVIDKVYNWVKNIFVSRKEIILQQPSLFYLRLPPGSPI